MPKLQIVRRGFADEPALDVAVSHSTLAAVARGDLGGVFRLHNPASVVAFGGSDRVQAGYPEAVRAARAHGFTAVERLAGGRAAVFHESTLAFAMAVPEKDPRSGITKRFRTIANIMATAFVNLGLDARVGEVPGEYCPGDFSVNICGRVKVMGVGQRLVRGAAHIGGVVVVDGGRRIRDVLIPIYRALALDWDPRTVGALADLSPGLTTASVADAIISTMADHYQLEEGDLPDQVVEDATGLIAEHLPNVA
jgi:octanoyl-[GcvH]:protein N-octanoyltransferase